MFRVLILNKSQGLHKKSVTGNVSNFLYCCCVPLLMRMNILIIESTVIFSVKGILFVF